MERSGLQRPVRTRTHQSDPAASAADSTHQFFHTGGVEGNTSPILVGSRARCTEWRGMKVLLISIFHPEIVRGGAQQVCYELFQGLKERADIDVTLLAGVDESQPAFYKSGARITGFDGRPDEFLFLSREYDYRWHKTSNSLLLESFGEFLRLLAAGVGPFHHFMLLGLG